MILAMKLVREEKRHNILHGDTKLLSWKWNASNYFLIVLNFFFLSELPLVLGEEGTLTILLRSNLSIPQACLCPFYFYIERVAFPDDPITG